jgi:hypothetical protein
MLIDIKTNKEVFLPRNPPLADLLNTREVLLPTKKHPTFFQLQTRATIKGK